MKKVIVLFSISLLCVQVAFSQYFQGSFQRDVTDAVNFKIVFKVKPIGTFTTQISYMEAAFRFPESSTPAFTVNNVTSNTSVFPGLAFQRFTPDYKADGFTYYKFVHNTAVVPSKTYDAGTEYVLFTITTSLPATGTPQFDMISNLVLGQYQFGAADGAGNFMDPGTGDQLYGPGFTRNGNDHIVPMFAGAMPVIFRGFNVVKKDQDALLTWTVEQQDEKTSHFEIERSVNGSDFKLLKNVEAIVTSSQSHTYKLIDAGVATLETSVIYYRIKQVDKDSRFVYTEVRSIKNNENRNAIRLHPNPASDISKVSFQLDKAEKVSIIIIDASGKTVEQIQFNGEVGINQKNINVLRLSKGTYKVFLKAGELKETLKLVK